MLSPTNQRNRRFVVQLLHELALAPDAIEGLEEQDPAEQLLRGDRGAAGVGIQQGEAGRELLERLIHHGPDRAEGMGLGDPPLRLKAALHVALLSVLSTHSAPPFRV